jgi:hypothetical protein
MAGTSSQRLSFAQIVLDMGLADKKALLKAKKRIKSAKASGKKMTVARACVDLEILTERQAKKVQHKLKRLKEGFASSEEFHGEDAVEAKKAAVEAKKKRKRKRSGAGDVEPSGTGTVEAKKKEKKRKAKPSGEGEAPEKAKKKRKTSKEDAEAPEEAKKAKVKKARAKAKEAKEAKAKEAKAKEAKAKEAKAKEAKKAKKAKEPEGSDSEEAQDELEVLDTASEPEAKSDEAPESVDAEAESDEEPESADAEADSDEEPESADAEADSEEAPESADAEADSEEAPESADAEAESEEEPESEDAAESDEEPESADAAESEDEAPKSKKAGGKKKGQAPKKAAAGKKPKLGKEIELESQRVAKQEGKAKGRGKPRPQRTRNRGLSKGDDEPAQRKKSNAPTIAIASAVIILLVMAVGVAMRGSTPPERNPADGPEVSIKTQTVTPPKPGPTRRASPNKAAKTKDRSKWSKKEKAGEADRQAGNLIDAAESLADSGKLEDAIAKLKEFPADLQDQAAYKDVQKVLLHLTEVAPEKQRLNQAIAAAKGGGDKKALEAVVVEILSDGYKFAREGFVVLFRDQAREVLGEEAFEEIVTKVELDGAMKIKVEDKDQQHKVEFGADLAVDMRGTPERHQAFLAQQSTFRANLAAAQKRLADRRAARLKELSAQTARAAKKGKNLKTDDGKSCKLLELTEGGFVIELAGKRVPFGWGNSPPKLGHTVKSLATDQSDGEAVYALGMYALKRALFDRAKRDFQKAAKLGNKRKVPDFEALKVIVQLFRGKHDYKSGKTTDSTISWDFTNKSEERDFNTLAAAMKRTVASGKLTITSPQGYLLTAANVAGAWTDEATLTMKIGSTNPPPAVWMKTEGGQFLITFGAKTTLFPSMIGRGGALASGAVKASSGDLVTVAVRSLGNDKLKLSVKVGDKEAFEKTVSGQGEITFMVGCKGFGRVNLGPMSIKGKVSNKWARRTLASAPTRLARELSTFEAKQQAGKGDEEVVVPEVFKATSAEDEVALEGIPETQRQALKDARSLYAQGRSQQYAALKSLEKAAENALFHAANFALAALTVRRDPSGALIRLDRATKGVQDFYEAKVARASALFWLTKYDEAAVELKEAIDLRPDYAPAYLVQANLQVNKGDYETAVRTLELAEELAPGDPRTLSTKGRVIALAEGPNWIARKTSTKGTYVLETDMVDYADQFVSQLQSIRKRYVEAFPNLVVPGSGDQRASVLIFSEPEGYYSYSDRTGVGRVENTLGHFNPWSGQLLLYLEEDPDDWNSFHVIFHEGMHQWCHSNGLELPFWANEGMAEYVGGTRLSKDGSKIEERGAIDSFLKKRLQNLTAAWSSRLDFFDIAKQSPSEFYAGNASMKYAQAWTMIHFFMESGDAKLKATFFKYLDAYKNLKTAEEKKSAQEGSKMQYIWNDTLGELPREETKARWEKWVQKLAKKAGMKWKLPN